MADIDYTKFADFLPLCKAMGMSVTQTEPSKAGMRLPFSDELVGDATTGVIHGGAVSVLLDSTCGLAVFLHPDIAIGTATIDLRIDYMRPAEPGNDILAEAEIYHTTRSVAFVRGIAWATDRDRPVAMATGAFTFAAKRDN